MKDPQRDRIAAAFDRELARSPVPPELRAQAVHAAVRGSSSDERQRPPRMLALVAALLAVAIVATLFFTARSLQPRQVVPTNPLVPTSPAPLPKANALAPGTYEDLNVDGAGFNVRFTVPAGWTWNGRYLSKGGVGLPDGAAIYFDGHLVQVYTDPCQWARAEPFPPTGSSVHDLVAALAAQPMRSATTPTARNANVPGLAGRWAGMAVELTVPDDIVFANCYRGEFRSWGPDEDARSHQGPGQRDLVWAVDLTGNGVEAGGQRLIIDAASFPGTPPDVMSEIEAILGSIAVGHWG